jgi:ABC-2 type transport system ATP-binding protein
MAALYAEGLTRLYSNGRGIREVHLQVAEGEIFGFLGPNGAGKTTLIRTVLGFLRPQAGRVSVFGIDAVGRSREVRRRVGYLPSDPSLYDFLTGRQHLDFVCAVRGTRRDGRIRMLADRLEVNLSARLRTLSRGNRQKVALLLAMAHDPDLLIFDEPTSGLDPLVQEQVVSLLREERSRGKTVFMSSHVLSEVEALCDRIAIIRDGRIVAVDSVEQMKKQRVKHIAVEFADDPPDLSGLPGVTGWQAEGRRVRFTLAGQLDPLLAALAGGSVLDLTVTDPPLEEVFRAFYEGGQPA